MRSADCSGGGDGRTRPWKKIRIGGQGRIVLQSAVGEEFGRTATEWAPRRQERESSPSWDSRSGSKEDCRGSAARPRC